MNDPWPMILSTMSFVMKPPENPQRMQFGDLLGTAGRASSPLPHTLPCAFLLSLFLSYILL